MAGFKIGFWNTNDLSDEKFSDDLFQKELLKFDIVFLIETWHTKHNIHSLNISKEYKFDHVCRKKTSRKGRNSGGIIVLYKKMFHKIISILDKSSENILWIKILANFGKHNKSLYVAAVYNSPEYSEYSKMLYYSPVHSSP